MDVFILLKSIRGLHQKITEEIRFLPKMDLIGRKKSLSQILWNGKSAYPTLPPKQQKPLSLIQMLASTLICGNLGNRAYLSPLSFLTNSFKYNGTTPCFWYTVYLPFDILNHSIYTLVMIFQLFSCQQVIFDSYYCNCTLISFLHVPDKCSQIGLAL